MNERRSMRGRVEIEEGPYNSLNISACVSAFTGEPYVMVIVEEVTKDPDSPKLTARAFQLGQLSPAEARDHGMAMITAAAAAEYDAHVVDELLHGMALTKLQAAAFLAALRDRREHGR